MPDVLSVLSKLPPVAATWTDKAYLIKRGVMGMTEYLLATENDVALFNEKHGVTPEQKRAMEVGCTLGWDSEAAMLSDPNPVFVYTAPFVLMLQVTAGTEDQAAEKAHAYADWFAESVGAGDMGANGLTFTRDGRELDLIETQSSC